MERKPKNIFNTPPNTYWQSQYNAQNYNRYSYCLNNPLAFTDPTGYIQQSAFADGCYELTPAYSAFQRAFGLQNFLLNAGRNNTMLAMSPLVAIGLLDKSTSGGSWSRSTGMSYYKSNAEGRDAGCAYNNYFNSWGNTLIKSETGARRAFANNMTAEQYLNYMSLTSALEGGVTPQSQGGPTIDRGGFVDGNKFYDYMLDQAKNNPVEVAAFELKKNGETRYFVLPWNKNDRYNSRFYTKLSVYGLDGYNETDIIQLFHTHPLSSNSQSRADREWSNNNLTPIWVISPNGNSYIYSPLDGTTTTIDLKYFLNL